LTLSRDRSWTTRGGWNAQNESHQILPGPLRSVLALLLFIGCGGGANGGNEETDTATIEVTGETKESIHLTLDKNPLYSAGTQFHLRYSNDKRQNLALQGPARRGTYGTHTGGGAALLQMQITPGAPGYSHNAFADECSVTVDRAEQKAIGGRFTCDFGQLQANGTFGADF
jgi:hypothetical protein